MRIALAQTNPVPGDLDGNLANILAFCELASSGGAELIAFPMHSLDGCLSGRLHEAPGFTDAVCHALDRLAGKAPIPLVIGCLAPDPKHGGRCEAFAFYMNSGKIRKGPANSSSYSLRFKHGASFAVGLGLGNSIPRGGAECVFLLDDGPYRGPSSLEEYARREMGDCEHSLKSGCYLARPHISGGFDSCVYRGASYAVSPEGRIVAACTDFASDLVFFDCKTSVLKEKGLAILARKRVVETGKPTVVVGSPMHSRERGALESDWRAIVRSTADYLAKNGFSDCVMGLSGGIDSALCACAAVDALGQSNVHCVMMPSQYSSKGSIDDAAELALNLGLEVMTIPISPIFDSCLSALGRFCGGEVSGIARENLQARIRTLYLMTLANSFGWALLNTGNKSEAAMGFSTLYGDTAGAFAPLGDVYKTRVFELARFKNAECEVIPESILTKPPSAELYDGQRDDDRLPPYEQLDEVLLRHVEGRQSRSQLIEAGMDEGVVDQVLEAIAKFEFKRRAEPAAPKLSELSFSDLGLPLTNRFIDKGPYKD